AMGLTRFPIMKFFWVSQLGMLPGTLVYVNAGTQLSNLESINGILSMPIIGSFVLLAIFPLLAKKLLKLWQQQRAFKEFKRPSRFDSNLIVIGAGAAGLVTAYIAAASKARVILIERDKMGGDCLNTGCVPSKALIRSSRIMHYIKRSQEFGIEQGVSPTANFPAVMQRIKEVIKDIEPHDSIERYTGLGVDCVTGNAIITSPWTVEVDGHEYSARSIVIATGGKPFIPPILGLDSCERLTSDTLWQLEELPEKLLVLGGGFIGCELAQAFQRLGSSVTIIEAAERLLMPEDSDVAAELTESFVADGVNVITGHKVIEFKDSLALCEDGQGNITKVAFDKVLVATGRVANTDGLGLENIALDLNKNGTVPVNEFLQSRYPNIYACGDVAGPFQLTHAAAHQAWYCAVNALFGALKSFRADYRVIPHGVFTEPEIARVGINEKEALTKGIAHETNIFRLDDLDRAIADSNTNGFIKVLTPPGKDKILGATIIGPHATDLLGEFTLAMRHNLGLRKILATIHPYPTYGEANKYAASLWQQRYLPQKLLSLSAAYNKWRRK
ncbi:MAG: FAD-dependent oxidoreductase, partial [Gammaproteobacteria bacterium]|nr:FAD-dependent oxidoreductase [Gammaproteobacteria bacterium]